MHTQCMNIHDTQYYIKGTMHTSNVGTQVVIKYMGAWFTHYLGGPVFRKLLYYIYKHNISTPSVCVCVCVCVCCMHAGIVSLIHTHIYMLVHIGSLSLSLSVHAIHWKSVSTSSIMV